MFTAGSKRKRSCIGIASDRNAIALQWPHFRRFVPKTNRLASNRTKVRPSPWVAYLWRPHRLNRPARVVCGCSSRRQAKQSSSGVARRRVDPVGPRSAIRLRLWKRRRSADGFQTMGEWAQSQWHVPRQVIQSPERDASRGYPRP